MKTSKDEREEWRKLKFQGMASAVGEYTPPEFWLLLEDIEELLRVSGPLPRTTDEERVRDLGQRMIGYWRGSGEQLVGFLRLLLRPDPSDVMSLLAAWMAFEDDYYRVQIQRRDKLQQAFGVLRQSVKEAASELAWYRRVIAAEMGYDGPAGDACCPLREWLQDAKKANSRGAWGNVLDINVDIDGAVWLVFQPYGTMVNVESLIKRKGTVINQQLQQWLGDRRMNLSLAQALGGTPATPGRIDYTLDEVDPVAALICTYSNKIMELDGAEMDQQEIPLLLGEFLREAMKINAPDPRAIDAKEVRRSHER